MGDFSKYSTNCVRCKKRITACGWFNCRNTIPCTHCNVTSPWNDCNFEVLDESGLKAMPLLFTGLDSFTRTKNFHEESVGDKIDDKLAPKCLNSELSIDHQFSLCEAIKVDAFQSEDNVDTISSTLLLIKVLFENLRLGFEIHQQFKTNTPKDIDVNGTKFFLLNQTSTKQGGSTLFANRLQKNNGIDPIKKKYLNCLRPFVYLVTKNSTKIYFASWSSRI